MAVTAIFLNSNIVKLELLSKGKIIGVATGFFLKYEGNWFLATNWHVFSGREPSSGMTILPNCDVPDTFRYKTMGLLANGVIWTTHEVNIGNAYEGSALWYQHPDMGQDCDVAAIRVDPSAIGLAKDILEPGGHDPDMFVDLGGDLFLPGFPLGLSSNGGMSIWKRATLASSLEFGHSLNSHFYVDTATREGMSGAPCLAISNWRHYSLDRPSGKMKAVERPLSWRLLGVYSGRRNASDCFEAQIGIVWRETLLYEVIAGGKFGSVRLGINSAQ